MISKTLLLIFFLTLSVFESQATEVSSTSKKSHLFETYGLFAEEGQTQFLYLGKNRFWGAIGSRITLYQLDSILGKPQILLNAGVQASLRKQGVEFLSDTLDVRVGISGLFEINSFTRFKVTIAHLSGHVLEDVPDVDLTPKNVGDETVQFRIIRDYETKFRLGGSVKYVFGAASTIKKISADQFGEWLPLGELINDNTPFISTGIEEHGIEKYIVSTHAQVGYYRGHHLSIDHNEVIRASIGWFNGLDPRQKYAHYKMSKTSFGYLGLSYEY